MLPDNDTLRPDRPRSCRFQGMLPGKRLTALTLVESATLAHVPYFKGKMLWHNLGGSAYFFTCLFAKFLQSHSGAGVCTWGPPAQPLEQFQREFALMNPPQTIAKEAAHGAASSQCVRQFK